MARNGALLAAVVSLGAWVGSGRQATPAVERRVEVVIDHVQLAKEADAAEQRVIFEHRASLKWNPPVETSSVVRDITNAAKP